MLLIRLCLLAVLALSLAGCGGYRVQDNPKQTVGAVAGAGLGALAGSQIGGGRGQLAAVAVGTLLGGFLGSEVGKSLDNADKAMAAEATHDALEYRPTGTSSTWRNPDSGHYGSITPTRTFEAAGEHCREYRHTVSIDGRPETVTGTACRKPDGTWHAV
jgi:surface antigen